MKAGRPWYLADVHYRPSGGTPWCGCLQEAVADDRALSIKASTDVDKVTCPKCLELIRNCLDGSRPFTEEPDKEMEKWS